MIRDIISNEFMGEIRQILKIFFFFFFSKVILAVSKVRHLPHLPPLCYGHATKKYHHLSCEFEFPSWRDVPDTALCDKVFNWLVAGQWFSPGIPVSSTNKTDRHDITEILMEVVLTSQTKPYIIYSGVAMRPVWKLKKNVIHLIS